VVLVAVDDLLFGSKIRSAAAAAGTEVVFARTAGEAIAHARASRPALAIFDLHSERIGALETIRALKADPDLASIHTLGFASHVRGDVVAAAREAGADEVMARSAFVEQLGEILRR
jgi:CheY-like chemotaxis protein